MKIVAVDTNKIHDWDSFHDVFAEAFGFPDFYVKNMNAWIDCMTCLDAPLMHMTKIHADPGGVVVLSLSDAKGFAERCPELYDAIVDCSAFVNYRRIDIGEEAVLALSFNK